MKTQPIVKMNLLKTAGLMTALTCFCLASAQAASITNADSSATLNLPASWVGGTPPGTGDVGVWDSTVQVNTSKTLGASASWGGIQVLNPGGPITIGADGNTLTMGASGINLSAATNSLTLDNPVVLGASQAWNVTNSQTLTVAGVGSGSGLLTLNSGGNNTGTIVLSTTANTYTGGTVIDGGTVVPGVAASFGTGAVTNNSGTLLLSTLANAGIIVNNFNVGGATLLDMNNRSVSMVLDGAFSGSGIIYITNDTASGSTLTFGGNGNGNNGNFNAFTGSLIVASNASGTASAGSIRFNNGGGSPNLGNAAMILNLGNGNIQFTEKNGATTTSFGALYGGANTELAKNENYVIGALNLNTTFAGTIQSSSSLTKNGTGNLTLTGNNPYTGTTTVNAGILQVGDGVTTGAGSLGTGAIAVNANGELLYNKPDAFSVANNISGGGAVIQTNTSTLTYTGNDTASGTFTVSEGTLALSGSGTISSTVYVASGAIYDVSGNSAFTLSSSISGSGSVAGVLTAASGTINPGGTGGAGTLTFSAGLTENGNVNNVLELSNPTGSNDLINIVGNLTLAGTNNIILSHFGGGNIPNGTYPLINYSGTFNGTLSQLAVTIAGVKGTLTNLPNQIAIVISPNIRGPLPMTWVGDGATNAWDTTSSNWVNGVTRYNFLAGDSVVFNNTGLPNTNVTLAILVAPSSVLVAGTGVYTFAGDYGIADSATPTSLTVTNSATLVVLTTNSYTGPTIVGGATLVANNVAIGGSPSSIGAALSNPTNLVFNNATFVYDGPSAATDRGAILAGTGDVFDVTNGVNLTEYGALTGSGSLTQVDSGTLTLANASSYSGGTVLKSGVLALGSNIANNDGTGGSGVGPTNSPVTFNGGTLQLFGGAPGASTTPNYNTFYNPLVVPAGQTGTLILFPRGPINTGNGAGINCSLSGSGTLNLEVNYVRDALSGNWSAFSGLINVTSVNASGDEMRINNNFGYSNATIYLNGTFTMDSTLTANATINIGSLGGVSTATIGSGSSSAASPNWCVGWLNTSNTFAGTISADANITKVGTGTWYLSGQDTYTGSTTVSNGVLALTNNPVTSSDGAISGSTNIFINAGAFLDVSGTSTGKMPLNSGQVICGYGTLSGLLDTTAGGTVSGGGGIFGGVGTLTITGTVNLGGTAWMKLNRSSSPNSDRLVSAPAGSISYGGTLVLTNIGSRLQVGDTFTLFSAPTLLNSFGTLVLPDYYTWNTSQLAINGTVSVTGVAAAPSITTVDFSQLANDTITINGANGLPNGPATVLSTTNLSLPFGSWTQAATGNFDGNGNLSISVTVDPTLPQQFFILQSN